MAETFEELKIRRKHRFIVYKIGEGAVEVETVGARSETFSDMKKALPFSDCRYCVYDQDITTTDGRPASKLWFICWFPLNATPYAKMSYTSTKGSLRERLPGVFDMQCASSEELEINLGLKKKVEDDEEDEDFDF